MLLRVGLVGHGAIGRVVADALRDVDGVVLAGMLVRPASQARVTEERPGVSLATSATDLLALGVDLVAECGGHAALREHAEALLRGGAHLLVASVGALADAELEARLRAAATAGRSQLLIPAGALAGLDALGAARAAGLDEVRYTGRKAPAAWRGTRAESRLDLDRVTAPTVFFEGSARDAALEYPQNANVVAAVALAGLGFDRTQVSLMVDPGEARNQHELSASGAFGTFSTRVVAHPHPANPKTSMLAPWSLVRSIRNQVETIVV